MARLAAVVDLPSPGVALVITRVASGLSSEENCRLVRRTRYASALGDLAGGGGHQPVRRGCAFQLDHAAQGRQAGQISHLVGGFDGVVQVFDQEGHAQAQECAHESRQQGVKQDTGPDGAGGRLCRGRQDDVVGRLRLGQTEVFQAFAQVVVGGLIPCHQAFEAVALVAVFCQSQRS